MGRLVKYTGYGNAAGLLARRGLLLGGPTKDCSYSSDSEDSDTEEYTKYKDRYLVVKTLKKLDDIYDGAEQPLFSEGVLEE